MSCVKPKDSRCCKVAHEPGAFQTSHASGGSAIMSDAARDRRRRWDCWRRGLRGAASCAPWNPGYQPELPTHLRRVHAAVLSGRVLCLRRQPRLLQAGQVHVRVQLRQLQEEVLGRQRSEASNLAAKDGCLDKSCSGKCPTAPPFTPKGRREAPSSRSSLWLSGVPTIPPVSPPRAITAQAPSPSRRPG
jgi:hypothetical protein